MATTVAATAAVTLPGPGHHAGGDLVLLAAALAAWGATLAAADRWRTLSRRVVLGAAAAGIALAVVAPPVGSTDVSSYAVYGRMVAAHHASPYTSVPAEFPEDPWYPRMAAYWHHTGSVYGPVFTGLSAAGMAWAGPSALRGRLFFQLLAAAALLGALALVDRRTRGDPAALAFVGLNPLLVASVVNGGHNDILVGGAVLAGVALVTQLKGGPRPPEGRASSNGAGAGSPGPARPRDSRLAAAGAVVALGALVKLVAVLALAGLAAWAAANLGRRAAVVLGGTGAGVVALGYLAAGGPDALGPLLHASGQQQLPALWFYPRQILPERLVAVMALATVAGVGAGAVLARRHSRSPVPPVAAALLAYLLGGAYVMAWYPAWVLPVLGLRWRSRLGALAALHSGALLLAAVERPDRLSGVTQLVVRALRSGLLPAAEAVLVVVLVVDGARRLRRRPPGGPVPVPTGTA